MVSDFHSQNLVPNFDLMLNSGLEIGNEIGSDVLAAAAVAS